MVVGLAPGTIVPSGLTISPLGRTMLPLRSPSIPSSPSWNPCSPSETVSSLEPCNFATPIPPSIGISASALCPFINSKKSSYVMRALGHLACCMPSAHIPSMASSLRRSSFPMRSIMSSKVIYYIPAAHCGKIW